MTVLVLGDCLTRAGPLENRTSDHVLMIEAHEFARRKPYHPHKLTLVFSAMRQFRDELRGDGYTADYCSGYPYYKTKTTGEDACPFNALYWDFLGRNENDLRSNHRMGLVYSHWDGKEDEEREAIHERAAEIHELAATGEL